MNILALSGLLNGIAATGLALLVYFRSPQDPRHFSYGLFGLTTAIWSFGYLAWQMVETPEWALWWCRVLMGGAIFIPVTFWHHVLVLRQQLAAHAQSLKINYGIGGMFLLADLTPLFVSHVQPELSFPFWPKPGPLFHLFLVWWIAVTSYALFLLGSAYLHEKGLRRRQYKYLLIATIIGFAGGATNFPLWYGIEVLPYGTLAFTFHVSIVAYTLLRYHLMDFSIFLEKGMSYLAVLLLMSQPVYPVLLLAQKSVFGAISLRFSMVQLAVHLLTVAGAYQMRVGTRGAIARTVLQGRENRFKALSQFSSNVAGVHDVMTLGQEIVQTLGERTRSQHVILFVLNETGNRYQAVSSYGSTNGFHDNGEPSFSVTDDLPRYLSIVQSRISTDELQEALPDQWKDQVLRDLMGLQADVCLPFMRKNQLLGFCAMRSTTFSGNGGQEDLGLVSTLSREAAMALENALLRREVKRSQARAHHLDRLRSLETMAGGLAHELYSPLTSIKAFVQLARLRKNDEEFLQRFHSVLSDDVHRLEQLIQEIRDYALPKEVAFGREHIHDILTACLSFIQRHPNFHAVRVDTNLDSDLPPIYGDRQQLKQVIFNLIFYVLYEVKPFPTTLFIKSSLITSATGDRWIQIEIGSQKERDCSFNGELQTMSANGGEVSSMHEESLQQGVDVAKEILEGHQGLLRVKKRGPSGHPICLVSLPISTAVVHSVN